MGYVRRFTRARALVPGEVKNRALLHHSGHCCARPAAIAGAGAEEKGTSLSAEQKVATLEELEEALIFARAVISERLEVDLRQGLILARQELQLNNSTKPGADSSSAEHATVAPKGLRRTPILVKAVSQGLAVRLVELAARIASRVSSFGNKWRTP